MWFRVIVVVAMVNFFSYVAIASAHGGDAINGYRHAGQVLRLCSRRMHRGVPRVLVVQLLAHHSRLDHARVSPSGRILLCGAPLI